MVPPKVVAAKVVRVKAVDTIPILAKPPRRVSLSIAALPDLPKPPPARPPSSRSAMNNNSRKEDDIPF